MEAAKKLKKVVSTDDKKMKQDAGNERAVKERTTSRHCGSVDHNINLDLNPDPNPNSALALVILEHLIVNLIMQVPQSMPQSYLSAMVTPTPGDGVP